MKRILIYIVILLAVLRIPLDYTDVGKLRPVETVAISREGGDYVITTDTGDQGKGATPEEALTDLVQTTPAVVYLDTARYLLLAKDATNVAENLRQIFRGTVQLYSYRGEVDMETVSKYLSVHGDGPILKSWNADKKLPVLLCADKQMRLSKRTE